MNVYITYDRYEHNEWLSIYNIETNKNKAIKHFREQDLVDFISYGPDDCHSFQLDRVVMTKKQYERLVWLQENADESNKELHNLLVSFYEQNGEYEVERLMCTDGCSDAFDVIKLYCDMEGLDYENDEDSEYAQDKLFNDDELFKKVLCEYIKMNY